MSRFHDTASNQHMGIHHRAPVARSYSEIAEILAEREGATISSAEVEQMCRTAESKIAHATRADPVINHWLARVQCPSVERSSPDRATVRHVSSEEYGYYE